MKNHESNLQIACVKWFKMQYPQYLYNFWATPNGGQRNRVTAIFLKKEGVLAGVADLQLAVPNKDYNGFFIEMKYGKGKQTESQKLFQEAVEKQGYKYMVIRDLETFISEVRKYLDNK